MKNCRGEFFDFLRMIGFDTGLYERFFDKYYYELVAENQKVNLFSRKMDVNEVWLRHFLDSVSVFNIYREFEGKQILDFGTGGGLPGVPIKILVPSADLTLLDSTKKKLGAVKSIVAKLNIGDLRYLWCRLESDDMKQFYGTFDIVVSRGVKITAELSRTLLKLLKHNGRLLLYKAVEIDDLQWFAEKQIHEVYVASLGKRRIVEISKNNKNLQ